VDFDGDYIGKYIDWFMEKLRVEVTIQCCLLLSGSNL
jgi:hypothetical protein